MNISNKISTFALVIIQGLLMAANAWMKANEERCRSGRTGRSRKPLTAYAVPGFESLSFRKAKQEVKKLASCFALVGMCIHYNMKEVNVA